MWALALALGMAIAIGCGLRTSGSGGQQPPDPWGYVVVPPKSSIKIGMVADLSGPYRDLGLSMDRGVKMALGETLSIKGFPLLLVAEDDGCQEVAAVSLAQKLAAEPRMAGVIGHMCSAVTVSAIPAYDAAKMALVSPSAVAADVTQKDSPIVFRVSWNDRIQGRAAARFAIGEIKAKRAAVIHDGGSFSKVVAEEFQTTFAAGGGEVVAFEAIAIRQVDFASLLAKLAPLAPDLIYFGGIAKEGVPLVQQLRASGIKSFILGSDGLYDPTGFIAKTGPAAEGVYVTRPQFPRGPGYREWEKTYEAAFRAPVSSFSAQSYDAAKLLVDAIEKVALKGKGGELRIGRKALVEALRAISYEGMTGPISFNDKGDRTTVPVAVLRVQNGAFRDVSILDMNQP